MWEVRAFTGNDARGRPTQVSRTVRGTKKDAQRVAAQLTLRPTRNAGGRRVAQLLDEWLAFNEPTWAPLTFRDHQSRVGQIKDDPIAQAAVAAIGVSDVDRWVARLRRFGVGERALSVTDTPFYGPRCGRPCAGSGSARIQRRVHR